MISIGCIVEGYGEVEAVPKLIYRIAIHANINEQIIVTAPIRVARSRIIKPNELERHVELAARNIQGRGGIFIILDSDDDPPCTLGPKLYQRAVNVRKNIPIGLVLAHREYESWFVATADSLGGCQDFPLNVQPHPRPEAKRGAKEWLGVVQKRRYNETFDQPAFTGRFDLESARLRAHSFDKCFREIVRLLRCGGER
jgi:hypothetical protein